MTLMDLFNLIGSGFDATFTWIGNIKLAYLAFWSVAGPLLLWSWGRVAESIYVHCWLPRKARKAADQQFEGVTIDL